MYMYVLCFFYVYVCIYFFLFVSASASTFRHRVSPYLAPRRSRYDGFSLAQEITRRKEKRGEGEGGTRRNKDACPCARISVVSLKILLLSSSRNGARASPFSLLCAPSRASPIGYRHWLQLPPSPSLVVTSIPLLSRERERERDTCHLAIFFPFTSRRLKAPRSGLDGAPRLARSLDTSEQRPVDG